jgi:hypothetical protein
LAVIEEFKGKKVFMGMWSRPVVNLNSKTLVNEYDFPDKDPVSIEMPGFQTLSLTAERPAPRLNVIPVRSTASSSTHGYAIGNTFGRNLMRAKDETLLLGGCGDLRNLLKSVAGSPSGSKTIVMNDISCNVMARNMIILTMIEDGVDIIEIVAVWANHALTQKQHQIVFSICSRFLEGAWPAWLWTDSLAELTECFRAWAACTMSLDDLLASRRLGMDTVTSLLLSKRATGSGFDLELESYLHSGSLVTPDQDQNCPNLTFLQGSTLQYQEYFTSSIFRAVLLPHSKRKSLVDSLLETLGVQFHAVGKEFKQQNLKVCVSVGNLVELLSGVNVEFQQPNTLDRFSTESFDSIDLSNVADYTSLPCLLTLSCPWLATNGVLYSQSMRHNGNAKTYVNDAIGGMSLEVFQELLQLDLVSCTQDSQETITTTWSKCSRTETFVSPALLIFELRKASNKTEFSGKPGNSLKRMPTFTFWSKFLYIWSPSYFDFFSTAILVAPVRIRFYSGQFSIPTPNADC